MDGSRERFSTEKEALKWFWKTKAHYDKQGAEFDMSCLKVIEEYNNVDESLTIN